MFKSWVDAHRQYFSLVPPRAGAVALVKYTMKIKSTQLAEWLVKEKSTLVVPGDHFGLGRYLRIGYGSTADYLRTGLNRISDLVQQL